MNLETAIESLKKITPPGWSFNLSLNIYYGPMPHLNVSHINELRLDWHAYVTNAPYTEKESNNFDTLTAAYSHIESKLQAENKRRSEVETIAKENMDACNMLTKERTDDGIHGLQGQGLQEHRRETGSTSPAQ